VPSKDDIEGLSSLSNTFSLINDAGVISSENTGPEPRKFIIQKKKEDKELSKIIIMKKVIMTLMKLLIKQILLFKNLWISHLIQQVVKRGYCFCS